jgi:phage terminase small subunit
VSQDVEVIAPSHELSPQQEAFADAFVANGGNATEAALTAGYAKTSARQQGHRLLKLPKVQAAVEAIARDQLASHAPLAIETLRRLMTTSRSDKVRLDAALGVLDRTGFSTVQRHMHAVKGELSVSIDLT